MVYHPEYFKSLHSVSQPDFISFSKFWSDFQTSLLIMHKIYPKLRLTEKRFVFFGWRSLDDLAFRSYEIYLLQEFVRDN